MGWAEEVDGYRDRRTEIERKREELFYAVTQNSEQENLLRIFLASTVKCPVIILEVAEALGRSEEHVSRLYNELVGLGIMARTQGFELTALGKSVVEMMRRRNALLKWRREDEKRMKFFQLFEDIDEFPDFCVSMFVAAVALPMLLEPLGKMILEFCRQEIIFFDPEGTPEPGFVLTPLGRALWQELEKDSPPSLC